jgi:hypothetical protein
MIRIAVSVFNVVALVVALVFALLWWIGTDDNWLEPAATTLPLLAVLTGIRAERWAAERERRNQSLAALRRELEANREVLTDPRFRPENQGIGQIYPRLALGAVTTTLVSGALNHKRDRGLVRQLMDWRNTVEDFNRRLDLTELRLCTVDVVDTEELTLLREVVRRPDGHFAVVARELTDLREALDRSRPTHPLRQTLVNWMLRLRLPAVIADRRAR